MDRTRKNIIMIVIAVLLATGMAFTAHSAAADLTFPGGPPMMQGDTDHFGGPDSNTSDSANPGNDSKNSGNSGSDSQNSGNSGGDSQNSGSQDNHSQEDAKDSKHSLHNFLVLFTLRFLIFEPVL